MRQENVLDKVTANVALVLFVVTLTGLALSAVASFAG
jgi:hypothetical protein